MCNGFFFTFLLYPCAWFNFHQSSAQSVISMNECLSVRLLSILFNWSNQSNLLI
jgi:hypothetical protein